MWGHDAGQQDAELGPGAVEDPQRMVPPNTNVECIPIEPEFKEIWVHGTWDGSKKEFQSYVNAAHQLGLCEECVDVVIVDGRAQGDCALEVLLFLREDSVLYIHDWLPERMGGVEQCDTIDIIRSKPKIAGHMSGGLAVLKPKPDVLKQEKLHKSRSSWFSVARNRNISSFFSSP